MLLLDEPTNDLDLDTLRALEDFLDDWPGIVVTVSHDRSFLDRVTDELLALDGRGGADWVRGGVGAWLAAHQASSTVPQQTGAVSRPAAGRRRRRCRRRSGRPAKPVTSRSPSTVRRQLAEAESDLAAAGAQRDALMIELQTALDHREMAALGERLATAQVTVDAAEEAWLQLAAAAEELGLDV